MKKVLSFILAVALLCSAFAGLQITSHALDSSGQCGENVTYTFDSGTGTLTISGTGDMYDYWDYDSPFYYNSAITTVVINNGVTSIGVGAFYGCSKLTSITIPDSVTSIGTSAFSDCSRLASVTIPGSVISIGDRAFLNTACYDNSSNWDKGVLYIGNALIVADFNIRGAYSIKNGTACIAEQAFQDCEYLTGITIPNTVTSIGYSAFSQCYGLTSVVIPDSVKHIDTCSFAYCDGLASISVNPNNKYYDSRNNCNAIIETATNTLIAGCKSTVIPNTVTSIGNEAFFGCGALTEISIPDGVTSIGDGAFYGCGALTEITIPDSVKSINFYAFEDCSSLTSITIGKDVVSIGDDAFSYCSSLKDVYYAGTEAEWNKISIGSGNNRLKNATIHFAPGGSEDIQYTVSSLAGTGGTVYLYKDGELAYTADSADGTFTLSGVTNGSYDVYVSCKFGVLTKVPEQLTVDGTQLSPVSDVYIAIGDVNGDGLVDVSDISSILLDGIYATSNADYDIDGSGAVDINDVSTVLLATNYGASAAVVG